MEVAQKGCYRDVAQLGRASRLGREGFRFDFGHPDHRLQPEVEILPVVFVIISIIVKFFL